MTSREDLPASSPFKALAGRLSRSTPRGRKRENKHLNGLTSWAVYATRIVNRTA